MSRRIVWTAPLMTVVLGAALIGLELYLGHAKLDKSIQALLIVVAASVALVVFQVRSETARVIAGQTVDERWAIIHRNALAAAASLGIVVGVAAYVVVEIQGGENWQFAFMIVTTSLLYLGALIWYRSRT